MVYTDKEPTFPMISIKWKETFSMSGLYELLRETLIEEGWTERTGSQKENFMETLYVEKLDPGAGKESWIYWRVFRTINSFVKETLDIDFHILTMKDTEIVHKGQKMKMQKGECEVFFTGNLIADYDGKWGKSKMLKDFLPMFIKKIYRKEWERLKIDSRKEMLRVHARVKNYLEVYGQPRGEVPFKPQLP